jgi:hypothetical protein
MSFLLYHLTSLCQQIRPSGKHLQIHDFNKALELPLKADQRGPVGFSTGAEEQFRHLKKIIQTERLAPWRISSNVESICKSVI